MYREKYLSDFFTVLDDEKDVCTIVIGQQDIIKSFAPDIRVQRYVNRAAKERLKIRL
jgi:hypothetical protein